MRSLVLVSCALFSVSHAAAQINNFTGPITGDWNTDANWSLGHVPLAGEYASINNNQTVLFSAGVTPSLLGILCGATNTSNGLLKVTGGTINTGLLSVGDNDLGTLTVDGPAVINASSTVVVANANASEGTFINNGGDLNFDTSIIVANQGLGTFTQTAGSLDASYFSSGNGVGQVASVNFQGGTVDIANSMSWGSTNGKAIVTISGADITSGTIFLRCGIVGETTTADMTSGSITTLSNFDIGGTGLVTFTQSGGLVRPSFLRLGLGSDPGVYKFQGGVLDVGGMHRSTGPYQFKMTGGIMSYSVIGSSSLPIDLAPVGGTISPRFAEAIQTSTLYGNLSLPSGVELELDLFNPSFSDRLVVEGAVKVGCGLVLSLMNAPNPGDLYVLIDNDGADPVIGEFLALPEGTTVTLFDGVIPYEFMITYVGGDGNDVVLVYVNCPPDLNNDGIVDNGDINEFLTLFLSGNLAADFNNDGYLDNGDIASFIAAFLAGC